MQRQRENAEKFREAHAPGRLLILPNAWDAASARIAENAGAKAIATSSAALAWCHGYADGEKLPVAILLDAVKEIVRIAKVPVSVDSEMGFSPEPQGVADYALALAETGAVGVNLEDRTSPPELLADKIRAVKRALSAKNADLFINARTDVYLHNLVSDEAKLAEVNRRGRLYAEAGADGLFVPALNDLAGLREVTRTIALPVNSLLMKATPPVAQLKEAGVRRISAGAGISRAAYGAAMRAANMLIADGRSDAMFSSAGDCPDFNGAFG